MILLCVPIVNALPCNLPAHALGSRSILSLDFSFYRLLLKCLVPLIDTTKNTQPVEITYIYAELK